MERLAKEKIAAQQKILLLKRELSAQWDHFDFSTIITENDVASAREKGEIFFINLTINLFFEGINVTKTIIY